MSAHDIPPFDIDKQADEIEKFILKQTDSQVDYLNKLDRYGRIFFIHRLEMITRGLIEKVLGFPMTDIIKNMRQKMEEKE